MTSATLGQPAPVRVVAPSLVLSVLGVLFVLVGTLHFVSGAKGAAVAVGVVVAAGILISALTNAAVAVLLLTVVVFTRLFSAAGSDRVAPGVLAVTLGLAALSAGRRKGTPDAILLFVGMAGAYLALCTLSSLWTSDPGLVLTVSRTLAFQMLTGLGVVACVRDVRQLRWALWGLIGSGFVVGVLAIRQYLTHNYSSNDFGLARASIEQIVGSKTSERSGGPVGDANFFGQMMVVVIVAAMERFRSSVHTAAKLFAGLTVLVGLFTVIITYSRGTLLALVIGAVLALLHSRHRFRAIAVTAVLIVLASVVLPSGYTQRLSLLKTVTSLGAQSSGLNDPAIAGRSSSWINATHMFEQNPIGGVGYGSFEAHYLEYSQHVGLDTRGENRNAHSFPLQVVAEQGATGFVMLVAVLWGAFALMRKSKRRFLSSDRSPETAEAASIITAFRDILIVYLVASIFLHAAYPQLLWFLLGLCYATWQCVPRPRATTHESDDFRLLMPSHA